MLPSAYQSCTTHFHSAKVSGGVASARRRRAVAPLARARRSRRRRRPCNRAIGIVTTAATPPLDTQVHRTQIPQAPLFSLTLSTGFFFYRPVWQSPRDGKKSLSDTALLTPSEKGVDDCNRMQFLCESPKNSISNYLWTAT